MIKNFTLVFFTTCLLLACPLFAQSGSQGINTNGSSSTAITTAVPFLTISPDSRSGALDDARVAASPDGNSTCRNPSKLSFIDDGHLISLSYSPWLRQLLPNSVLSYLSYAQKFVIVRGLVAS